MATSQLRSIPERGTFDSRYLAFLETITHLRPKLHRYCARMTGSVLDGEDVMQDALFQAYRKLGSFDDTRPLAPWLFRIAHNQCIDFLRRREVREGAEAESEVDELVSPPDAVGGDLNRAIEHLVLALPPKERACVLLKDVFDYSLEEVAELVDSTVGGVKAALHRGRARLAGASELRRESTPASAETRGLLRLYVDRLNQRDWDGLRELVSSDARVGVADRYAGSAAQAPYFRRFSQRSMPWRASLAEIDGELAVVVHTSGDGDAWTPQTIVRFDVVDGRIAALIDYNHCPWVLASAPITVVE
jgi:RNA polymerase sigma-70 factor (ECF subfamily)